MVFWLLPSTLNHYFNSFLILIVISKDLIFSQYYVLKLFQKKFLKSSNEEKNELLFLYLYTENNLLFFPILKLDFFRIKTIQNIDILWMCKK